MLVAASSNTVIQSAYRPNRQTMTIRVYSNEPQMLNEIVAKWKRGRVKSEWKWVAIISKISFFLFICHPGTLLYYFRTSFVAYTHRNTKQKHDVDTILDTHII